MQNANMCLALPDQLSYLSSYRRYRVLGQNGHNSTVLQTVLRVPCNIPVFNALSSLVLSICIHIKLSKSQIPLRYLVRRWFEAGRRQVRSWSGILHRYKSVHGTLWIMAQLVGLSQRSYSISRRFWRCLKGYLLACY